VKLSRHHGPLRLLLGGTLGIGLVLATGCGGGSDGGVVTPSASVTLLDVQVQVFGPSCALTDCHTSTNPPHQLDLSSVASSSASLGGVFSGEVSSLLRIEPGNATDSYLYMKLVDDSRILGDPMPLYNPSLGSADLALIETWINEGAM